MSHFTTELKRGTARIGRRKVGVTDAAFSVDQKGHALRVVLTLTPALADPPDFPSEVSVTEKHGVRIVLRAPVLFKHGPEGTLYVVSSDRRSLGHAETPGYVGPFSVEGL